MSMYTRDGYEKVYMDYKSISNKVPDHYHRYESNLCDPTQDDLPITMPDPNEDISQVPDSLEIDVMYGSMKCGKCNNLNYCQ